MTMIQKTRYFAILSSFMASSALAGPITTVPWNGHTGAVSFTYDDARTSQIPNLLPQLDELKIKATFFIAVTGTGGDFEAKKSAWIQAAKNGHELANHTRAHGNVPADPGAASIILDMAKYLRDLDPAIESVTFAYPNCNVNGKAGIGAENFMSRGCGQVNYAWASQPSDWMNIQGLILQPGNVNTAITMLNNAKTGNTWVSTIVHDVKENPDTYSLTPADNKKMLQAGVSNNLWIDTYEKIGAYYRAHFTIDAATATTTSSGWKMTWTSPHPKLPKSIKLRVKLAEATFGTGFVVEQSGQTIMAETDGSYIIDFMKLSLDVLNKPTGTLARAHLPQSVKTQVTRNGILFAGTLGRVEVSVTDVQGHSIFQGIVSNGMIPLHPNQMKGLLFLTLRDGATKHSVHTQINALH